MSDQKSDIHSFEQLSTSNRGYILAGLSIVPLAILYSDYNVNTALSAIVALFSLLFIILGTTWSISVKKWLWYTLDSDGKYCYIQPTRHRGKADIVEIVDHHLEFQKAKFKLDNHLLIKCLPQQSYTIDELANQKGVQDVKSLQKLYGQNQFQIQVPSFNTLFKQHLVKPFFLFQLFCVSLWMFDEMWYYSLFTLMMLFVFEATVVTQRLRTLKEFHQMQHPPFDLYCYRNTKWQLISSLLLVPSDIISIKVNSMVPCDCILLHHSAIVNEALLSGESTPVLKETAFESNIQVINKQTPMHMLFGGTQCLQIQPSSSGSIPNPPDDGAIAMVYSTGFNTTQGELVRTMVFSSEPVGADSVEAFLFIAFLTCFALVAAIYVWHHGSQEPSRDKYKLFLNCIMIVTSCVPPELPMELSLAVNTSLMNLSKLAIFSTEPFRIPYAGRIDVCCFDKTGTLTESSLQVEGLVMKNKLESDPSQLGKMQRLALATAHSLVLLETTNKIVGDSIEQAVQQWLDFKINKSISIDGKVIKVVKKYPFTSKLARMATINQIDHQFITSVKGAPEKMKSLFKTLPSDYDKVYSEFASQGGRVLAIGSKITESLPLGKLLTDIENDLEFCGFLVLKAPLKPDAKATIDHLRPSHHCVMITGDNALTACHVAKQVNICTLEIVTISCNDTKLLFSGDFNHFSEINPYQYNMCITGPALELLMQDDQYKKEWLVRINVYARITPDQKEILITNYKELGLFSLMAGDGSNDVGALKQAHVGVALLNGTEAELDQINKVERIKRLSAIYEKQCDIASRFGQPRPPPPMELARHLGTTTTAAPIQSEQMTSMLSQLEDDVPVLKFGDASIAAPFTSKLSHVSAIEHIIKQGRCTLVTTIQMYKILALNCLISAYSMSVLYLEGIKWGDWQLTVQGILLSICFLTISKGKPLQTLSKERPQTTIFNWYVLLSVLGQTAIHGYSFYIVSSTVQLQEQLEFDFENKKKFEPSMLNTTIYLLSMSMQTSTFFVNYIGRPFREDIKENSVLYRGLLIGIGVAFIGVSELITDFNKFLQLVALGNVIHTHIVEGMANNCHVGRFFWIFFMGKTML